MDNQNNNDIPFDETRTIISTGGDVSVPGLIGKTLGEFEITREIGRGGMGVVYEAFQKSLNRKVALKVLPESFSIREGFVERFHKEAKVLASLSHPNIIPIYQFGEQEDIYYFAMELVEGTPLSDILTKLRHGYQFMSQTTTFHIMKHVASGLQYAHEKGVLHMDIKPGNILIEPNGRARIADFGLVKLVNLGEQKNIEIAGTPMYMSPEQFEGRIIDHRSDIYSLGCVFYELITGAPPFKEGSFKNLTAKVAKENPVAPSIIIRDTPLILDDIVLKMLRKRPDERYQTMSEFLNVLDRFQKGLLSISLEEQTSPIRRRIWLKICLWILLAGSIITGVATAINPVKNYYYRDWARTKINLAENYLANGMRVPALKLYREIAKKTPTSPAGIKAKQRIAEIEKRR